MVYEELLKLKLYSDELKKLQNPIYMKELYEPNKDFIGEQARKKVESALKNILNNKRVVNVIDIAKFFLREKGKFLFSSYLKKFALFVILIT